MSDVITVPFSHLILHCREIGIHRGRKSGFRDVFGFPTLRDVRFIELASLVKEAYEGTNEPPHEGWSAQREALRWLVEKGRDGIYALDEGGIEVRRSPGQSLIEGSVVSDSHAADPAAGDFHILDGHHRALALFVLGATEVRARINTGKWTSRSRGENAVTPVASDQPTGPIVDSVESVSTPEAADVDRQESARPTNY